MFVLLSADREDMESQILQGLNPAQRDAVVNYDSPSLIIAGAGSGKTRVLTSRIAYMIEQGVAPQSIITMTFTKKAANEMRNRIQKMIPDILTESQASSLWMGTFHSVFARILRLNAERKVTFGIVVRVKNVDIKINTHIITTINEGFAVKIST